MIKNDACLYIVATPIGNLNDISQRAIVTIKQADIIVCENPKHSLKLLNNLGIKKKLFSLHDYNEDSVIKRISSDLREKKVVLVSDSGSPLVSDPGYKLVKYCIKNSIKITSIPGPSSIIPALQLSGIPMNEFHFSGFFPKNKKGMLSFVKEIKDRTKTTLFFVSSHKIEDCLNLLDKEIGPRKISVSKELTKLNEKVFWGSANEIKGIMLNDRSNLKGEFVLVVEGKSLKKIKNNDLQNYSEEGRLLLSKFSLTDVVEIVHKLTGITKNKIYKWALDLKKY